MIQKKTVNFAKKDSWDNYFLDLAIQISKRSPDSQTKHGCVIVQNKKIIGTGYNGFIHGVDDSQLPTIRPAKYPFMIHSELNAILNCILPPIGATAYITGKPCLHCFQCLYQAGISEIIYKKNNISHMLQNPEEIKNFKLLLKLTKNKIKIKEI